MENINNSPINHFSNVEEPGLNYQSQIDHTPNSPILEPQANNSTPENLNNADPANEERNISNENSEENDENKKKHNKRRSKREAEGRNYTCKICSKSYLSYPALYTHYKQKHNTNNSSGRGRGRPKKETNEGDNEKNNYNPLNHSFFLKEGRTGNTPQTEINNCIEEAFKDLYNQDSRSKIESRGIKFFYSIDEHPFLSKFKQDAHDINKKGEEKQIADLVFMQYLNNMSQYCNPKYYTKLIKFVTLFREHSNSINQNKVINNENNKEYTEVNPAEDVPDSSNEFITDFIDPEEKKEDLGFSKEECIDLTQNLCHWMYENNFTCSKLSLIHEK